MRPKTKRTSKFVGVSRHCWTGRWEAMLWDAAYQRPIGKGGRQSGKQIFIGGFESELDAAHAYDVASLSKFGERGRLNFQEENYYSCYADAIATLSFEDLIIHLRKKRVSIIHTAQMSDYDKVPFVGPESQHNEDAWPAVDILPPLPVDETNARLVH